VTSPLLRLRRRLTLWYVGVFALILLAFGAVTYTIVVHQVTGALDRSLVATIDATAGLLRREPPAQPTPPPVLSPGRRVWVLNEDLTQTGYTSTPIEPWVLDAARTALVDGEARVGGETPDDRIFRLRARAVSLPDGRRLVVVAAAVQVEIEDQYPSVFLGFSVGALLSLCLVALGGWRLARRSLDPVDRAMTEMRRFTADAAHELRTPLAVLRGHADVARQRKRTEGEYDEVLHSISREAARLGDIVERMLLLARADAGDWPTTKESLFLDDVVLDVGNSGRALGAARGVHLEVDDLDEAPVKGDPALLRQLLMAIVDNAVKFSPDGGTVRLGLVRDGDVGRVTVDDEGPGIPETALPHVFERFFRADPARTRQQGAGLGLSIAEWIAQLHGAALSLEPRPGGGTRALVTIPLEGSDG
jgi:signal transduction histidine kinase